MDHLARTSFYLIVMRTKSFHLLSLLIPHICCNRWMLFYFKFISIGMYIQEMDNATRTGCEDFNKIEFLNSLPTVRQKKLFKLFLFGLDFEKQASFRTIHYWCFLNFAKLRIV